MLVTCRSSFPDEVWRSFHGVRHSVVSVCHVVLQDGLLRLGTIPSSFYVRCPSACVLRPSACVLRPFVYVLRSSVYVLLSSGHVFRSTGVVLLLFRPPTLADSDCYLGAGAFTSIDKRNNWENTTNGSTIIIGK